jgi:DNA repair protein RadC
MSFVRTDTLFSIKDLPQSERPRERLIQHGSGALSEAELLAILLRTGTSRENVVELATRVLKSYNIRELSQVSLAQLREFRGISNAKACQIAACFELARRVNAFSDAKKTLIGSSKDVARILMPEMRFLKKEHFVGLYLDSRNQLIKKSIITIGSLNGSIAHPREIFKVGVQESANSVILAHNHPSGNPKPSQDDILITKKLVSGGRLLGIPVLDHVVIGESGYVSMAEEKLVDF